MVDNKLGADVDANLYFPFKWIFLFLRYAMITNLLDNTNLSGVAHHVNTFLVTMYITTQRKTFIHQRCLDDQLLISIQMENAATEFGIKCDVCLKTAK
jgi:hypothetical protein